jgi:hypothetical protein
MESYTPYYVTLTNGHSDRRFTISANGEEEAYYIAEDLAFEYDDYSGDWSVLEVVLMY